MTGIVAGDFSGIFFERKLHMARRGIRFLRKKGWLLKNKPIEKQIALLKKDLQSCDSMIRSGMESRLDILDAVTVLKKEQKRSRLKLIHCGK